MSSLNVSPMFSQVPQPLRYAEALLQHFATLARAANGKVLLGGLVNSAANLSGCELSQLYLLDSTHTRLTLSAEWQGGLLQPRTESSLPSDYDGEQLLQYCLCQNQTLSICELDTTLHQTSFLPETRQAWRSLLCQPLLDEQKIVNGLLLIASHKPRDLQGFAGSLGQLGSFVIAQLHLLQRLHSPQAEQSLNTITPCASGYGLIGESPSMHAVYRLIGKVLHNPVSVLLAGETGTGKELVARQLHAVSGRRGRFVALNCGAISESLLEAELFGYSDGAFTGARRGGRVGLVEAADGGTLFLDEIGELPLPLQTRLLRVLEEREVLRVGATEPTPVDLRVVAATLQSLEQRAAAGSFRRDLYYRLAALRIALPSLRARRGDIPLLAQHFFRQLRGIDAPLDEDALAVLTTAEWPGNVRELRNLVDRLRIHWQPAEGPIDASRLLQLAPELASEGATALPLESNGKRPPRAQLEALLQEHRNDREGMAQALGVSRTTLWRWLRAEGL